MFKGSTSRNLVQLLLLRLLLLLKDGMQELHPVDEAGGSCQSAAVTPAHGLWHVTREDVNGGEVDDGGEDAGDGCCRRMRMQNRGCSKRRNSKWSNRYRLSCPADYSTRS